MEFSVGDRFLAMHGDWGFRDEKGVQLNINASEFELVEMVESTPQPKHWHHDPAQGWKVNRSPNGKREFLYIPVKNLEEAAHNGGIRCLTNTR